MAEIEHLEEKVLAAQFSDTPFGFECFYELIFGRKIPKHVFKWIEDMYDASAGGDGIVIEAARNLTKTTTGIAFMAFQIGHHPWDSNMIIQAQGDSAAIRAQKVADLISNNPGWKIVFPFVTPEDQPWARQGYQVKSSMVKEADDSEAGFKWVPIEYEAWLRLKDSVTLDPTFAGYGYSSSGIIGKHPTGVLIIDDIHTEENSRSERDMLTVKTTVEGTIMPITTTPEGDTRHRIVIGTPWKSNDVMATYKAKEGYRHAYTPIVLDGVPAWPEHYPLDRIKRIRNNTTEIEFARMYLLDLTAAEGIHLKAHWLQEFQRDIDPSWPVVMGVDYASTADQWETKGKERDYFAVAEGRVVPGGGAIIVTGGFRGHVSQGEAEQKILAMAKEWPTLQMIGVEAVGKGEEFYHLLLRNTNLPIMPLHTKNKSKGERFEAQMAPLFELNRAYLSPEPNTFLDHFRREWLQFPNGIHDDVLDAVFWMLYVGRHHLMGGPDSFDMKTSNPLYPKKKGRKNPALAFGKK